MVILGILVLPPLPIPIIHLLLQLLLLLLLVIIVTIKNGIIGIMEVFGVRRNYPMRREITSGIATDPIDFLGGAGTPLEEEEDQVVEVIDIIIPQVIPGITILLPLLLLHLPLGIAIVIIVIAIIIGIIILLPLLLPHPPLGIVIVIIIGMIIAVHPPGTGIIPIGQIIAILRGTRIVLLITNLGTLIGPMKVGIILPVHPLLPQW